MNNISPNTLLAASGDNNPTNNNVRTLIQFLWQVQGATSYYPTPIGLNDVGYGASDETFFFNGLDSTLLSTEYQENVFMVVRNLTSIAPFDQKYDIRFASNANELIDIANSYLFEGQSAYTSISAAINGMLNGNILIMPYNLPNFSTNLQITSDDGNAGNLGIVCGFISGFTSCISKYMNLPTYIRCFTSGYTQGDNVGNIIYSNTNPITLSYANNYGIVMVDGEHLELNNTGDIPFGNEAFSFSCWFNADNTSVTQVLASWGYIQVQINNGRIDIFVDGGNQDLGSNNLIAGTWYNVFYTYDTTSSLLSYELFNFSGSIDSSSITVAINNPTKNFYLSDSTNVDSFVGYIKSSMLYSFTLSQTQIDSDFANMLPLVNATPSVPTTTTSTTSTTTTICAPFINSIVISNGSYTATNGTYNRNNPASGFTQVDGTGFIFNAPGDGWYINYGAGNVAKNTSELGTGTWEPWAPGNSTGITAEYFYYTCPTTTTTTTTTTSTTSTTTTIAAPTATTDGYANLTPNTAQITGTIVSNGGSTITERGIVYSISPNPTIANNKVSDGAGNPDALGQFIHTYTILGTNGNTCYVKIYATNAVGTSYGSQISFSLPCFIKGTKITLASGLKKNIEDISYEDSLLVWNFDEGRFDSANPIWIMTPVLTQYVNIIFSDGSKLGISGHLNHDGGHRIFNLDKGEFTYAIPNEHSPIGTRTFNDKGDIVTIVGKEESSELEEIYNVVTNYHLNIFAEGILTSRRLNNLYPIADMKFIKDERSITSIEEFKGVPAEYYEGLRLGEQPLISTSEGFLVKTPGELAYTLPTISELTQWTIEFINKSL
jgi:hypothetical protein